MTRVPFPWNDHMPLIIRLREQGEGPKYIRAELLRVSGLWISSSAVKEKLKSVDVSIDQTVRDKFMRRRVRRCGCGAVIQGFASQCRACYVAGAKAKPPPPPPKACQSSTDWQDLPDGTRMRLIGDIRGTAT